jgi:hypothetical protein
MTTKKLLVAGLAVLALTTSGLLTSCKKDKTPVTVTECFRDDYNGNYTGSGVVGNNPAFSGTLTLTKKGCQEAEIKVGTVTENITSLAASAGGGYVGKNASGASASISLSGNTIGIVVGTTINFSGSK